MANQKPLAELTLSGTNGNAASFTASFTGHKNTNLQNVWVACNSYSGDVQVSANFAQIQWDGDGGTVTVGFDPDASRSEAFCVLFPDVWTARSNTVEF